MMTRMSNYLMSLRSSFLTWFMNQLISPEPSEAEKDDMSVQSGIENEVMLSTADANKAREWAWRDQLVCVQWKNKSWDDGVHEMEACLDKVDFTTHVSEVYSPPRVTGLAGKMGLDSGMALDLSVLDPDDGKPWDFNDLSKRTKALHMLFTGRINC